MNMLPYPNGLCVAALVLTAAAWDVRMRRIPNWLVVIGLVVGLVLQWHAYGVFTGVTGWAAGTAAGIGFFLLPYLVRGLGAGDVKLMGAVGAITGAQAAFAIAFAACIAGGVLACLVMLYRGQVRQTLVSLSHWVLMLPSGSASMAHMGTTAGTGSNRSSKGRIPFALAIGAGAFALLGGWV